MNEGDIALAPLPQADGQIKNRPVVLLRRLPPSRSPAVARLAPAENVSDWTARCVRDGWCLDAMAGLIVPLTARGEARRGWIAAQAVSARGFALWP